MSVEALDAETRTAWDFLGPVRRFPLPVLCALALTALNWTRFDIFTVRFYPAGADWIPIRAASYHLSPFLIAAFFLTFALVLYGEAKSRKTVSSIGAVIGVLLLAVLYSAWTGLRLLALPPNTSIPVDYPASSFSLNLLSLTFISRWFLLGGLALLPVLGPFTSWRAEPGAFWQFAHKLGVAFLAALTGAGLAFAGFAAIVETAKLLFGLTFPQTIYAKAGDLAIYFASPMIWLALTPGNFDELPKTGTAKEFTSRAVALLVKYILIPVASVLSLMLVAYIALVLAEGRFETARLGFRSLVYGSGVILTALLAYPEREDSRLVRVFWRVWPWLLVAPSLLFFPALWVRIGEYGWTPFRYLAFIAGIWMASAAILATRFRSGLRFIPGILALLLILAAFGPWGVSQVTGRSQAGRLEALLTERGVLAAGRWREGSPAPKWTGTEQQQIQTALFDLATAGQLDRLKPWFQGLADDPFAAPGISLTKLQSRLGAGYGLGTVYSSSTTPRETVRFFSPSRQSILKIPSGGYVIGLINWWVGQRTAESIPTPAGPLDIKRSGAVIEIRLKGKQAKFDLKAFLADVKRTHEASLGTNFGEDTARLLSGDGDLDAKLAIVTAEGNPERDEGGYTWTGYILLPAEP
jgi:Domain of unknown function (DUF4153)